MKKLLVKILKWALVLLSLGYIAVKLWKQKQSGLLFEEFAILNNQALGIFVVVLILMLINWSIESFKWQKLLHPIEKHKFLKALKGVLAGVSVSIFTPNRVGEFGGRLFFLEPKHRVSGIAATLTGNLSQLLITLSVGFLGIYPFTRLIQGEQSFPINFTLLFVFAIVVICMGLFVYFNVDKLEPWFQKLNWWQKAGETLYFFKSYNKQLLWQLFLLSFLRYLVFAFQFYLLLLVFGIELSFWISLVSISQIYLVMTLIPTFALTEIGVRGSVALLILGCFSPFTTGIMAASVTLWIINLAIPALAGSIILLKQKIK